jgi:AAA+ superfamily predicted ATPase
MARSDIVTGLVKAALAGDLTSLRKAVEALVADEHAKNHHILADRLSTLLSTPQAAQTRAPPLQNGARDLVFETIPQRQLDELILPVTVTQCCRDFVEEHQRGDLLKSYGLLPRNKILLVGPPGNGKTSLAEALAYELAYPLLIIRYESLIGSYLGETASRLQRIFDVARTRQCVLFFDEFETLGKERGDTRETGEIKRVVSSLLLQIDRLPHHTVVITASNHPELLDRAVWRRFQLKLELPNPDKEQVIVFLQKFEEKTAFSFKKKLPLLAEALKDANYAEVEDFCLDILRKAVLQRKQDDPREIVAARIEAWRQRFRA